jgi:hypothetical protein
MLNGLEAASTLEQFPPSTIISAHVKQMFIDPDPEYPPDSIGVSACLKDITGLNTIELHLPGIPGKYLVRQAIAIKTAKKLVPFVGSPSEPALSQFDVFASTIGTDTLLRATHRLQHLSNSFACRIPQINEDRLPQRRLKVCVTKPKHAGIHGITGTCPVVVSNRAPQWRAHLVHESGIPANHVTNIKGVLATLPLQGPISAD